MARHLLGEEVSLLVITVRNSEQLKLLDLLLLRQSLTNSNSDLQH